MSDSKCCKKESGKCYKSSNPSTGVSSKSCCKKSTNEVVLNISDFDTYTDEKTGKSIPVKAFTWKNSNNISVQIINYGGTITSIKLPNKKTGLIDDIVLGFDDITGYQSELNPYFGATIGRNANRIGGATIVINGITYELTKNEGENQLHGGIKGFDKVMWDYKIDGVKLTLSYTSVDGEEGFPGEVNAVVTFELTNLNELLVNYSATTSKSTIVNLTNHSYFNLAGHNKGASELFKHLVTLNADKYTEVDPSLIPTGNIIDVANTIFDLREPKILGDVVPEVPGGGFDHNFCVNLKQKDQDQVFIAKVEYEDRIMEVYSNQPGVQFYTGNQLEAVPGKDGAIYGKHGALVLETQNYPDAINHENFPNAILNPGEVYQHAATFKFFI